MAEVLWPESVLEVFLELPEREREIIILQKYRSSRSFLECFPSG